MVKQIKKAKLRYGFFPSEHGDGIGICVGGKSYAASKYGGLIKKRGVKQLDFGFTSGIQEVDRIGDFNPGETYRIEIDGVAYYAKVTDKHLLGVTLLLINFAEESAELRDLEYDALRYHINAGLVQGIVFHDWC